jgi:hypothetical protein
LHSSKALRSSGIQVMGWEPLTREAGKSGV